MHQDRRNKYVSRGAALVADPNSSGRSAAVMAISNSLRYRPSQGEFCIGVDVILERIGRAEPEAPEGLWPISALCERTRATSSPACRRGFVSPLSICSSRIRGQSGGIISTGCWAQLLARSRSAGRAGGPLLLSHRPRALFQGCGGRPGHPSGLDRAAGGALALRDADCFPAKGSWFSLDRGRAKFSLGHRPPRPASLVRPSPMVPFQVLTEVGPSSTSLTFSQSASSSPRTVTQAKNSVFFCPLSPSPHRPGGRCWRVRQGAAAVPSRSAAGDQQHGDELGRFADPAAPGPSGRQKAEVDSFAQPSRGGKRRRDPAGSF